MTSALQTSLSVALALGLIVVSATCVILWRRVHALAAIVARPPVVTFAIDPPLPPPAPVAPRVVVPGRPRPGGPGGGFRGDVGPTLIAVPNLATAATPPADDMDRRFADVWALADSGASAATIADRTGYPIGQVELILGLRRRSAVAAEIEVGADG